MKINLKILLFHEKILNFGGAERLLFEEFKYFKKNGIYTKILTFKLDEKALDRYKKDVMNDIIILNGRNAIQNIYLLRKMISVINPHIIITASGWKPLFLATIFRSFPYIIHIHGTIFWFDRDLLKYTLVYKRVFNEIRNSLTGHREFIPLHPRWDIINRIRSEIIALIDYLAVKKAKAITVLTERVGWEVNKLYKRSSIVVRGCLDPKIFYYNQKTDLKSKLNLKNKRIILSVSRLDRRKRIDLIIKAFAVLSKKYNDIVLVIVGSGPEENKLKELTNKLRLNDKVIFTGFVKDEDLWEYYNISDIFIHMGWTTSPITTYEALAFNKKVIWTSEADEPDEILNVSNVLLSEPNLLSLITTLERALSEIDLKDKSIKEILKKYTWNSYFKKILALCVLIANKELSL